MNLYQINHPLLTPKVIERLLLNNINTVSTFVAHQPAILHAKCELLNIEDIFDLRNYFIRTFQVSQVSLDLKNVKNLTNDIIELKSDYVYEIYGRSGCGKTQVSMYLAAELAKHDKKVLYIDTKNDFSVTRLKSYFGKGSSTLQEKFKNIKLAKAFDLHQALLITDELAMAKNSSYEIDLIILDNIASLVLPLLEDDSISETFAQVGHLVKNLKKIALKQNCAVLVTNNASNRGSKPALGKIFDRAADKRFFLRNQQCQNETAIENMDSIVIKISEFTICKE